MQGNNYSMRVENMIFFFIIGVETTRRFLLEWLSFLHRYVPVGILEKPPQRMNERVPEYHGKTFSK